MAGLNPRVLKGMSEEDAKSIIEGNGMLWRISKRDGRAGVVTRDIRPDRITMEILDGIVVGASTS